MKVKLNINHVNRLFELTDKHMGWFSKYYPNTIPTFSSLLRRNHNIIIYYCLIDLYNSYSDIDINHKLDRMFNAADGLQELSSFSKESKEVH